MEKVCMRLKGMGSLLVDYSLAVDQVAGLLDLV
jgi:hypothetical protein